MEEKRSIDSETKRIILSRIETKKGSKFNRGILGAFLVFCILVVISRIVQSILLDMGLHNGEFHIGYWSDVDNNYSFKPQYEAWKLANPTIPDNSFSFFVQTHDEVRIMINHHPFSFWWLTQFTWLTTIIVIIFLSLRFFGMTERVPKWLSWIMSQKTLSHVAMWDLLVGVFFWSGLATSFASGFSDTLFIPEYVTTICVHGIIPLGIVIYAIIYLVRDKKASLLKEMFALKGLIFPAIYSGIYMVLTIVWYDPYDVTSMHDKLISDGWGGWASELWKLGATLVTFYILLGLLTIIHNLILVNFNKNYDPENDYESLKRKEVRLKKIRQKFIQKEISKKVSKMKK